MARLRILPFAMNSMSSRSLSRHFGTKRIYRDRAFRARRGDVILNWGVAGAVPCLEASTQPYTLLNNPGAVNAARDKRTTLRQLTDANVPTLGFHTTRAAAEEAHANGITLYARTQVAAREGRGIVVVGPEDQMVDAPLYTEYFKNGREYRVHVFDGKIIDYVKKSKMSEERAAEMGVREADRDSMVRNLKKGWSFVRQGVDLPQSCIDVSIAAVEALGLDFGAVDLAYSVRNDDPRVLEINTAPGMKKGTTTHYNYVKAISEYMNMPFTTEGYNAKYDCDVLNAENDIVADDENEGEDDEPIVENEEVINEEN